MLDATWNGVVHYDPALVDSSPPSDGAVVGPLAIELEEGWAITNVTMVLSGRELEVPTSNTKSLLVWPESGELVDRKVHVRVRGRRPLPAGDQVTVPRRFFVRWLDIDSDGIAMISTSSRIRFYSVREIQSLRISDTQLSPELADLLGVPGNTVCYLELDDGAVPSITFDRASSAFDARIDVGVQVDDGVFSETFSIAIENVTGRLDTLDIRMPVASEVATVWDRCHSTDLRPLFY